MPSYRRLGELPPKRHTQLANNAPDNFLGEKLFYEHILTTVGFDRAYSIMYHRRPPTRMLKTESAGKAVVEKYDEQELRHHHVLTQKLPRSGDPIRGRIPMMFNDDLTAWRCLPSEDQKQLFRNGAADEVIFIHHGSGYFETSYGKLPYRRGDYVVMPRSTTWRIVSDDISKEDHLILETFSPVRVPARYQNPDGQMYLGSPYYERDFHSPTELVAINSETPTEILIKDRERLTLITMPHHPFDVVGWDGFLYPFTFNAWDFEPLTGTTHLPPPYQQTFECRGFVICTFAPRFLDHHPKAVKVPYVHSNVEADEVLFYVDGEFGSRKGVGLGSLTLHPGGIPHGPHPGTIMKSMKMDRTEEMAVMFDTDRRLHLTPQAMKLDDPKYPLSWMETTTDSAGLGTSG